MIGLAFALNLTLRRPVVAEPKAPQVAPGLFRGAVTGFTRFVSHGGAPPYQVYTLPIGLAKAVFAGTSTIAFAIINAVKLVPNCARGQLNTGNLKLAAVLSLPAALAVFAGVRPVNRMPERLFFRLVTWALLAISLKLIWDGVRGLIRPVSCGFCGRLCSLPAAVCENVAVAPLTLTLSPGGERGRLGQAVVPGFRRGLVDVARCGCAA